MSVKISALPSADSVSATDQIPISKYQGESKKITYSQIIADMNSRFSSYNNLTNKPSIEGIPLQGNQTFDNLGLVPISTSAINTICT